MRLRYRCITKKPIATSDYYVLIIVELTKILKSPKTIFLKNSDNMLGNSSHMKRVMFIIMWMGINL